MACNCIVKDTLWFFDIVNKPEDIIISPSIDNLIPAFSSTTSGIWRPVFYSQSPSSTTKPWTRAVPAGSQAGTGDCECETANTQGLGIGQFIKVTSPKFRNWEVEGNLELHGDLIVRLDTVGCTDVVYNDVILFWYRYYDMARENDERLLPGVDIFISDGDYAVINGEHRVSPSLSGIALNIKAELDSANVGDSLKKACILASGPQIDGITEVLAGTDRGFEYPRDEYGLMQPFLRGMSLKRYSDIGSNNFIVDKIDLLKKIIDKYSLQLVVPERCTAKLTSKFLSSTGPNVEIKASGALYHSDKKNKSGYDISFSVGKLAFTAKQSSDTFIPKTTQIIEDDKKITVEAEQHHVNYFNLNNTPLHYNLTNSVSGIFNPDISSIRFHGLGGVDFSTSSKFGSSCLENVAIVSGIGGVPTAQRGYYTDTLDGNGPWFLQDYNDPKLSSSGIESEPTKIGIEITAHENSQFRLTNGISVHYLRSDTKASCSPFITDTCNCFPLVYASPYISGQAKIENKDNILFVPNTSYYHMPSGAFYGGLAPEQVLTYGVIPPGHPTPGTFLPRTHSKFFPSEKSCSYSLDGCGDRDINFKFPYPGEIKVTYQSTKANFKASWGDTKKENPGSKFTSTAGVLCLPKPSGDPDIVNIKITVPSSEPETQWGIQVNGIQSDYSLDTNPQGYPVSAKKGFFHPNFGWTFDPKYHNKTPSIPSDIKVVRRKITPLSGYRIYLRYSNTLGPCPGGHVCDRAKFSLYANGICVGTANLNNGGGPDDPGPDLGGDRTAEFALSSEVSLQDGKLDLFVDCQSASGCHTNIAWLEIKDDKEQVVYSGCIETQVLVSLSGIEAETFRFEDSIDFNYGYFYNALAMYKEEYLPGYNFIYNVSGLTEQQKYKMSSSTYVGLPTNGNSYYIANQWKKNHYIPSQSLILEQMPFEFINMNYKYGYAYNDFIYEEQSNGDIVISSSSNGSDRAAAYLDMPYFKNDKFVIYSYDDIEKTKNITVNFASGNIIKINESPLPSGFKKGFLQRTKDNQSVLIYQPYTTVDKNIGVGKWGNMSYGDAIKEASKYFSIDEEYDLRRYNNSSLRTGVSKKTSLSWGAPIAMANNYSVDNQTYYFPTTRLFPHFIDGERVIHTLGYNNNDYTIAQPEGDRIVASGSIGETTGYIYLGSYIGNYTIGVSLNDPSATDGTIKLYHMDQEVASKEVSSAVDNTIVLSYEKQDALPVYARLSLENTESACLGAAPTNKLLLNKYSVKISDSISSLQTKSRLSYYAHSSNITGVYTNKSYAYGYDDMILKINDEQVSPLNSKITYLRSSSLDYSPYLDMHIFAQDSQNMPIVSQSGYIYFEDFLKPKSFSYIANDMEVPYDEDLYWLDFPKDQSWSILTSRGLLLEPHKTYKILKSLSYDCKGKAQECSTKYKKDLCEEGYEISEGEALELLGLSGEDREFIDIITRSFPKDCATIDKCCSGLSDTSAYDSCLEQQKNERESCAKLWEDKQKKTSCLDVCPTGNITGVMIPSAEYFILSIKNNLRPDLDKITETDIKFFNAAQNKNLPCTTISLPSVGTSFFRNITCTNTNKCDYITPIEHDMGSQYVPGELIDLSPLVLGVSWEEYPVPSSVIMDNELRYRSLIPHPNQIALPLEEYDRIADSKYVITHNFNIKSQKCIPAGPLFDISVDNIVCSFQLLVNASGSIIRSSCFKDIVVKSNPAKATILKAICEGPFTCKSDGTPCEDADADPACNPSTYYGQGYYYGSCVKEASCDKAQEYLDEAFGHSNNIVVECTDVSLDEDYTLDCRYCGPQSCSASISYYEPMEQECHCPDWAELVDAPEDSFLSGKVCVHSHDITYITNSCGEVKTTKGCDYYDYGYYPGPDGKCYFYPSCFSAIAGPTEEELTAYEEACPEGVEQSLKRTEQEVISILQEPSPDQRRALADKQVESQSKYLKKACEINTTWAECATKCGKDLDACNAKIPPGEPNTGCYTSYYLCFCDCQKEQNSANNKNLEDRTSYYNCYSYCNTSDSIWEWDYYGYGYGWWYGWGDNCNLSPCNDGYWWYGGSSWTNPADDACAPGGCGYSSCENLEKRMAMSQTVSKCECKVFDGGPHNNLTGFTFLECTPECVDLKVEKSEQISSSYSILTREKTYISKTKTNYISMKEKTSTTQTRKVINKKFEITYKNKDVCKDCTQDQICCENKCIDKEEECCENKADIDLNLKFEIYDNMIVVFLNNIATDRLCVNRGNYGLFKCPKINFNSKNPLLYMCDSVSSECTDCYTGEFI